MLVPTAPLHHQSTETFLGSKNTLTKLWSYSIKYSSGHIKYHTGGNYLYYSTSSLCQDFCLTLSAWSKNTQVTQSASSMTWQKIWWTNKAKHWLTRALPLYTVSCDIFQTDKLLKSRVTCLKKHPLTHIAGMTNGIMAVTLSAVSAFTQGQIKRWVNCDIQSLKKPT